MVTNFGTISIYNPVTLITNDGMSALSEQVAKTLENTPVTKIIIIDHDHVSFMLESGNELRISVRDEDYRGPEAICFNPENDEYPIIVI